MGLPLHTEPYTKPFKQACKIPSTGSYRKLGSRQEHLFEHFSQKDNIPSDHVSMECLQGILMAEEWPGRLPGLFFLAGLLAELRSKCGAAEQVRSKCGASAELV